MDDASQRAEEIESLSAIYAEDINLDDANGVCEVSSRVSILQQWQQLASMFTVGYSITADIHPQSC
jgi:hypothetical protein